MSVPVNLFFFLLLNIFEMHFCTRIKWSLSIWIPEKRTQFISTVYFSHLIIFMLDCVLNSFLFKFVYFKLLSQHKIHISESIFFVKKINSFPADNTEFFIYLVESKLST